MKKAIRIITFLIMFAAVSGIVAICSLTGAGKQFFIDNSQLKAAVADVSSIFSVHDSEEVFAHKLGELTAYFKANDLNTAIIPFNSNKQAIASAGTFSNDFEQIEYLENKDILKVINRELKKEKIQLILALECSTLSDGEIADAIEEINSRYYPAGIIAENYFGDEETLCSISTDIKDNFRNYYFGIRTDRETAEKLAQNSVMNLFIISDDTADYSGSYINWKNTAFADAKILLNYESPDFANDLFILSNFYQPDGYVLAEYTGSAGELGFYHNLLDTSSKLTQFGLSVDNTFAVTNPSADISTYAGGIFVTGSADTEQPLYINGILTETAADGTFGMYVQLEEGDNAINVVQGENSVTRTVTGKVWQSTGKTTKMQYDDTKKAYSGQVIETINPLTSILSDPDDDSRIMDGLQQGVQMIVEKSVKTQRDGKYTWAYQLSNGGYILAKNVEWIDDENYQPAVINAYFSESYPQEDYNTLGFALNGKPAVVSDFDDEGIRLTFLNTELCHSFDGDFVEQEDMLVLHSDENAAVPFVIYQDGDNLTVEITDITEEGFWGYNIEYQYDEDWQYTKENSFIEIYLKNPPHKSEGAYPLEGITVMLDAGHGGKDVGALGVGGVAGPDEKDINLAVTLATKDVLEKFGATVYLTRSDDTFLTLEERRSLVNQIKPDLFIAQHHNSLEYTVDAAKTAGVESYYFTHQSKILAEAMTGRISDTTGRNNRGFAYGYFYVLRNDIAPGVLNEYGFVVNPYEYANLYSDENIYKAAFGTAMAVLDVIPE